MQDDTKKMEDEGQRKKRIRVSFSLKTMFVAITIFGVWLGWQVRIVQQRKAVMGEIDSLESNEVGYAICIPMDRDQHKISAFRRWLGDRAYGDIVITAYGDSFITRENPLPGFPGFLNRVELEFPESALYIREVDRGIKGEREIAFRDSLFEPMETRQPNRGRLFKTGKID